MLTVSTFIPLHEKNNLASQFFVIISYYRFTYEIHKCLYVHPRAVHIIYTAWLFSTIGFTQSVNMYKTTDTDCLPIWQISARYRLSVNHYFLQFFTVSHVSLISLISLLFMPFCSSWKKSLSGEYRHPPFLQPGPRTIVFSHVNNPNLDSNEIYIVNQIFLLGCITCRSFPSHNG